MEKLKILLNVIAEQFPVKWDRWTKSDQETPYFCVYGWIARKDGQRDFLVVEMWEDQEINEAYFVTSSAKYSAMISELITGTKGDHNPCIKIEELFKQ